MVLVRGEGGLKKLADSGVASSDVARGAWCVGEGGSRKGGVGDAPLTSTKGPGGRQDRPRSRQRLAELSLGRGQGCGPTRSLRV